ncbi:hypothetical protein KGM48_02870 [Patescibacteria group bacterium]|nr:hypothetical protein [Patescibacteria group bacterium]
MTMQSITSDQSKQFTRFVEDASNRALKEVSPDKDGIQRLIERGGEFQAYIVAGISRFTSKLPDYTEARSILGKDFISADQIATARDLTYTEDQLIALGKSLPDKATLEAIRDAGMFLVAGPPTAMSMLDIRALHADYFYSKGPEQDDEGWYDDGKEKFSRNDKIDALGWLALRKEPVNDSLSKNWEEQRALVQSPLYVPNAAEVTWGLTTYKAVNDVYLLEDDIYVRTSSLDSGGYRVYVGYFDASGLYVYDYWVDYRYSPLGVASARKF